VNEEPGRRARLAGASRRAASVARRDLLEEAAEASRAGIATRRERLLTAARPIVQTSVAAALAWIVATEVLGHTDPFFAPVAAVVTLGLTIGERRRRAVELALGVSVGIAIGDLIIAEIGSGAWQIGVVVALAMFAATLVGGGPLLASQAGASAVLVATIQFPEDGFDFTRAVDALAGATCALAVGSFVWPAKPLRMIRVGADPVIYSLAQALDHIAAAIERRDPGESEEAVLAVSAVRPYHDALEDTVAEAADAARMSLGRREALDGIADLSELTRHLRLAIGDARSLARGVGRAIALEDATPPEVVAAVHELARSTRALHDVLESQDPSAARESAIRAASLANAVLEETTNLSALHIVGQIRLLAVDLLRASGEERDRAQRSVRAADPVPLS
jgi:uncharacterized membrane protein YgaE (UPF0421/DUF939 family)